ncbi:hypothetical protein Hanom_Chr05g00457241 [Helianthus anomalus]
MLKNLIVNRSLVPSPNVMPTMWRFLLLLLLFCAVKPPVMRTAIRELSMMAVEANKVDAIMLFLSVWTARTPVFCVSCYNQSSFNKGANTYTIYLYN